MTKTLLPLGWCEAKLERLISYILGGDWGSDPNENLPGTANVRVIRGTEFRAWNSEKGKTAAERCLKTSSLEKRRLQYGDVVLEVSGGGPNQPVGRTVLIDNQVLEKADLPLVCSNFFRLLRFNSNVRPAFVNHFLTYLYARGTFNEFQTETTNLRNLNVQSFLEKTSIHVPPLNEQRRIVQKLDLLLHKIHDNELRLKRILKILKRFRQSVLAAACSGRLTADWREQHLQMETGQDLLERVKSSRLAAAQSKKGTEQVVGAFSQYDTENADGDEENGKPDTWARCTIGMVGIVSNGSTPSRKSLEYWDGSIPWVSSGEVRNNIISTTRERITENGFESTSIRMLPVGTVLLAMIGEGKTRGQAAILKLPATINQNVAAVVINNNHVSSEFLWHWFQFQYTSTREKGSGSGPQALNCQRVRELPFVLPPLAEQEEIVRRVESLFTLSDQLEARYKKGKAYVDKLTQSILAKAFRGELVPQDPNDEPAEKLLERIRTGK